MLTLEEIDRLVADRKLAEYFEEVLIEYRKLEYECNQSVEG